MSETATGQIRPKAICLLSHEGRILAIDGLDSANGERFWVPVGGGIDFGETSRDAIARELLEELGVVVVDVELLGVLENIFTHEGTHHHEIVFIYDGTMGDRAMYESAQIAGEESDGTVFTAHWIDPFDPPHGRELYPAGLADLLRRRGCWRAPSPADAPGTPAPSDPRSD